MNDEVTLLFHTPVGKRTRARYTAAANYRYITRGSATDYAEHHRMPGEYKAAQDWLRRQENTMLRLNRYTDDAGSA